jgi:hypothetical protein
MLGVSGLPVSFYSASIALPGRGVFNIVQLTLIGLKLASVVSWPWPMVLLPVWFGLGSLFIIALGIGVAVAGNAWPCSCRIGETTTRLRAGSAPGHDELGPVLVRA